MTTLLKTITITLTLSSMVLFASSSHSHANTGQQHSHEDKKTTLLHAEIEVKAKKELARLVSINKINASWLNAPVTKMGKKTFGGKTEWAVVFDNKNMKDDTKTTLYIFLDLNGNIAGVNYTGN